MAKYSTGSGGSDAGATCELCGAESGSLERTRVAGADLHVCGSCATHGESPGGGPDRSGQDDDNRSNRKKKAAQNVAKTNPIWDGDSEHWEREGTNYDEDPLPYLVPDYGERLVDARQAAGLQREELADEIGVRPKDLLAVEQERATQAGVGGGIIDALEEHLEIELSE